MRYREFDPHAALTPYVQCYAEFVVLEAPPRPYAHLVMPDGCTHLTYLRPPTAAGDAMVLSGARMRCAEHPIRDRLLCWDVKLRPDGLGLLGLEAGDWIDRVSPLSRERAPLARRLADGLDACDTAKEARRVLDAVLVPLVPQAAALDAKVAEAVQRIEASDGRQPIAELATYLEISERQLQRRFRRAVGLTPKQFARIRRFRACARNLIAERPEAWGRVAVAHGYADQAHLNREFARLSGRSPTQLERYIARIEHENTRV